MHLQLPHAQLQRSETMTKEKSRPGSQVPPRRRAGQGKATEADGAVEKAIGNRLRAYYDEMAKQPVPDRFLDLLKQLDDRETGKP